MNTCYHRNDVTKHLSNQLLRWICERIPDDDPIRIRSLEDYKEIQSLGKGRFGEVVKFLNTSKIVHMTVKRVKLEMFDHWSQSGYRISQRLDVFIDEFRHLHRISLANSKIANFHGLYADEEVFQALKALNYLHTLEPPVIHRDIKAANLLLTISDSIKLANFGLVRDLAIDGFGIAVASDISLDFRGTLLYVAPEILISELGPGNRKAYGKPADVWALGCTLIEMLTKYPPHFEYFGQIEGIQKEILDRASGDPKNWLPYSADVLVPTCSSFVHKLVDVIFERDPKIRPNTSELCDIVQTLVNARINRFPEYNPSMINVTNSTKNVLETYAPLETLENGVMRKKRKTERVKSKRGGLEKLSLTSIFFLSRALYFAGILGKSILYVVSFLLLGLGILTFFLLASFCIVLSFRYLIKLTCNCDLWQPQYIIISGILLILLFALMFSCCMVALGEYKFRIANKTLRESRFYVRRPQHDLILCGVKILRRKNDHIADEDIQQTPILTRTGFLTEKNA
ncbi:unnamed protein product [Angiostrongylus costaricensis]|uniref:Protein kinase domain-containing protein n=1 Tax=Angiostrongylus costaricensis TaxID=334426 RepID=A0A158PJQ6_ANGCS|nr:unnamed protein product [Angiostrongylus costaricensis]